MRYGGTAAGFTPAEAKAPTLDPRTPQSTTQQARDGETPTGVSGAMKKQMKESSEDEPSQPGADDFTVATEGTPCPGRPGPAGRDRSWPTKTHAEQHIPDSDKQPRRQRHIRHTQRVQ